MSPGWEDHWEETNIKMINNWDDVLWTVSTSANIQEKVYLLVKSRQSFINANSTKEGSTFQKSLK